MHHATEPHSRATPVGDHQCRAAREVLDLVANKWAILVVFKLSRGALRFSELQREITGVSHRMLTVTLRSLERFGILTRSAGGTRIPHVIYELTTTGHSLAEASAPLVSWTVANISRLDATRRNFDADQ